MSFSFDFLNLNIVNLVNLVNLFKNQSCILCDNHDYFYDDNEAAGVCPDCMADLRLLYTQADAVCPTCVAPSVGGARCELCQKKPPPFTRTWASVAFSPPFPAILQHWKHHQKTEYLRLITQIMRENPPNWLQKARLDYICAMPISLQRRIKRGFNQSEELAEYLSDCFNIDILDRESIFRHHKTAQSSLNRAERIKNIHGVFEIQEDRVDVRDKRILLIDDVFTTGATLTELSRAFHEAGAERVFVWVFARTLFKN